MNKDIYGSVVYNSRKGKRLSRGLNKLWYIFKLSLDAVVNTVRWLCKC